MTPTHHDPDDYYGAVRLQYEAFEREALRRRNEGEGDYRRVATPAATAPVIRARTSRVTLA